MATDLATVQNEQSLFLFNINAKYGLIVVQL